MQCANTVLFTVLLLPAGASADPALAKEKNWLDSRTWPVFVADRPVDVKNQDDALKKLMKERYNVALKDLRSRYNYWLQGAGTMDQVHEAVRRVTASRLEIESPAADRVQLLKEKLEFFRIVEGQAQLIHEKERRTTTEADVDLAKYARLDAEVEWTHAERAAKQPPKK